MTNVPFTVYQFPRINRGQSPDRTAEVAVEHHATFGEAADAASELRRTDPRHSYGVGMN